MNPENHLKLLIEGDFMNEFTHIYRTHSLRDPTAMVINQNESPSETKPKTFTEAYKDLMLNENIKPTSEEKKTIKKLDALTTELNQFLETGLFNPDYVKKTLLKIAKICNHKKFPQFLQESENINNTLEFEKNGNFTLLKSSSSNYNLDDYGGKAKNLIENQQIILDEGFKLPNAICIPWQEFISIAIDNEINVNNFESNYSTQYFNPDNVKLTKRQKNIIKFITDNTETPFFSSSSPDEDSLESRMFGVYSSVKGNNNSKKNLQCITCVVNSYYDPLGSALRKKHNFKEKGMGMIVRNFISDKNKKSKYAIVAQTGYDNGVLISITKGDGENIVSGQETVYQFHYDSLMKGFWPITPTNLDDCFYEDTHVSITDLAEKLINIENKMGLENHNVDFEMAVDGKGEIYMLQCSPVKKMPEITINKKEQNELLNVKMVLGNTEKKIKTIVVLPSQYWGVLDDDEKRTSEKILSWLYEFNKHNKDYLIVGTPAISTNNGFPMKCFCNAAGVIELLYVGEHTHRRKGQDHYSNLVREEGIAIVHSKCSPEFTEILGEYIRNHEDSIDYKLFENEINPIDLIKILDVNMVLKTNEYQNQAQLKFVSPKKVSQK